MAMLVAGLVLFLGMHSVSIVAPAGRDRWAAALGAARWKGFAALVSLLGFGLLVAGFGVARAAAPLALYAPPYGLRLVAVALMLPVFPLVLAAALPGRISRTLKHPLLAATKAWALAHLLANGTLPDVLLFGGFLLWAVADRVSLRRRIARPVATAPAAPYNDALAVGLGLALYAGFLFGLHARLFGVAPLG